MEFFQRYCSDLIIKTPGQYRNWCNVDNKYTITMSEICSKLKIKTNHVQSLLKVYNKGTKTINETCSNLTISKVRPCVKLVQS